MDSPSERGSGIVGLGADVVSIARVQGLLERHRDRFLSRVLTAGERQYAAGRGSPAESIAARFAAKEACFKAVGQGWPEDGISYQDVEVVRGSSGPPRLRLRGRLEQLARLRGATRAHLTLSHTGDLALAVVVLEAGPGEATWIV